MIKQQSPSSTAENAAGGGIARPAPKGATVSARPHIKPAIHRALFRYRLLTGRYRMLPDFVIIGMQKCGTTSLYNYLAAHPLMAPALRKEVHFFDFDENFQKGSTWYRAHFPLAAWNCCSQIVRGGRIITGEATPFYMDHPLARQRLFETIPDARLIAILRNPVDRAYSQYQHQVRGGGESLSFEEAIAQEQRLGPRTHEALMRDPYSFGHYSYLSRGVYVDHLQAWTRLFPRDRILVLMSEDLKADPAAAVNRAFKFLGLPAREPKKQRTDHEADYPRMRDDTRQRLLEFFRPHNQRLYEYLGMSADWDR